MHLLFYGRGRAEVLGTQTVEHLLREQSVKEGRIYDSPLSVKSIPSFVRTYGIDTSELLQPDITAYKTFNEFFSRYVCHCSKDNHIVDFHAAGNSSPARVPLTQHLTLYVVPQTHD